MDLRKDGLQPAEMLPCEAFLGSPGACTGHPPPKERSRLQTWEDPGDREECEEVP